MADLTPTHHRDVAQIPQQTKADLIRQCQDRSAKWAVAKQRQEDLKIRIQWQMAAGYNAVAIHEGHTDYAAPQDFAPAVNTTDCVGKGSELLTKLFCV